MVNAKKKQKRSKRKAQTFAEYSMLACCVVAAIVGLQIYLKRTLQGKFREAADGIGGQYAPQQSELTVNTLIDPIDIAINPKAVWLKYPNGTINKTGVDVSGQLIIDSYDLPVYGIETNTTYSETLQRSGTEEMDKFESSLF